MGLGKNLGIFQQPYPAAGLIVLASDGRDWNWNIAVQHIIFSDEVKMGGKDHCCWQHTIGRAEVFGVVDILFEIFIHSFDDLLQVTEIGGLVIIVFQTDHDFMIDEDISLSQKLDNQLLNRIAISDQQRVKVRLFRQHVNWEFSDRMIDGFSQLNEIALLWDI